MNLENVPEKKQRVFSLRKRLASTNHAARGAGIFFRSVHNAWVLLFFSLIAVYLGFALRISSVEWAILVLTSALVITLEAVNTAIEIDINLTSPEYHPCARDAKDVAAGAVLIAVFLAGIIGMIIFLPKVIALFS